MINSARSALEERLGTNIPDNHPIHTWLCQYGGAMQRRYTVGDDGRTAFERVHGRRCAQHVAEFGERVWWMDWVRGWNNLNLNPVSPDRRLQFWIHLTFIKEALWPSFVPPGCVASADGPLP